VCIGRFWGRLFYFVLLFFYFIDPQKFIILFLTKCVIFDIVEEMIFSINQIMRT
jgi:hypothetical protein